MNIVFHRYNSICETDYIDAFKRLGIDVIEDDIQVRNRNVGLDEMVEIIGRLVLENHPIFVFSINFFPFISIVCERLQVKYVCVSVDCPVMEIYNNAIRNTCNRVFLFDYEQYLSVKEENPDCIFHLPLGTAVERLDVTLGRFEGRPANGYQYDVSFVGSLYNEKDPYPDLKLSEYDRGFFDGLISAQEQLPGLELIEEALTDENIEALKKADSDFYPSDLSVHVIDRFAAIDNCLAYHLAYMDRVRMLTYLPADLKEHKIHFFTQSRTDALQGAIYSGNLSVHGGVSSLVEMPRVFRSSRININHTMRAIRTGLPQRVWDILGCGGFLITNDQAEIPQYLVPGEHLVVYHDMEELCDMVRYYLLHEEEREQIAMAGYEEVKNHHSVSQRALEIIKTIA